jgi:hypothetical protein
VGTSADLSVSMSDAPDPVAPGQTLTYTIVVANAATGCRADNCSPRPQSNERTFVLFWRVATITFRGTDCSLNFV